MRRLFTVVVAGMAIRVGAQGTAATGALAVTDTRAVVIGAGPSLSVAVPADAQSPQARIMHVPPLHDPAAIDPRVVVHVNPGIDPGIVRRLPGYEGTAALLGTAAPRTFTLPHDLDSLGGLGRKLDSLGGQIRKFLEPALPVAPSGGGTQTGVLVPARPDPAGTP